MRPAQTSPQSLQQKSAARNQSYAAGATSLIGALSSFQAARSQARQFKIQQVFLDLDAQNQKLKAREQSSFLRQKFLNSISSTRAGLASRGVSSSSGIGRQSTIENLNRLGQDLQAVELQGEAIQNTLSIRGSQAKFAQQTARNLGLLRSSSQIATGIGSLGEAYQINKEIKARKSK